MSWNEGEAAADSWNDGGDTNGFTDGDTGDNAGGFGATDGGAGAGGGGGADFTCRKCGEAGHKARECPTDPEGPMKCFNCGQEGHAKTDCTNPKVFTGTCRRCEKQGHPASECPDKPPVKCYNCKEEGHSASECKANRVFDMSNVPEVDAEAAWDSLEKADKERELDDFRTAFKVYCKAIGNVSYDELERSFRLQNFNVHLIATEKELPVTHTFVNLQGELDKTYQVGFYLSDKPKREIQKAGWPKDAEDNLERLKDAGMPMERGIPKCPRCNELGHTARGCPEEAIENPDRVEVKCVNCDEVGHRARDCTQARKDRFACRNCKQSGHTAAECTEPRSAEGVECRKCNEVGHFSKDCPTAGGNACRNCGDEGHKAKECDKPRNPATVTCRNCDEQGHFSKECPKPRDYSKVQCKNCGEMGHTPVRCKKPVAEDDGGFGSGGGGGDTGAFDAGDSMASPAAGGDDNWGAATGGDTGDDNWGPAPVAQASTASAW